jgi:dimethylaniline monooxygenase (N-oxide forming)
MSSRVGGLWVVNNDNGRGGAYRSLTINTSHRESSFSEFAYPPGTADYPSHVQVAEYLSAYARRFDLERFVRFRSEVLSIKSVPSSPLLRAQVRDLDSSRISESTYQAVIVANGHHFAPSFPPGHPLPEFSGRAFHTHHYQDPEAPMDCRGKRICVVGLGNSAVDIACELAKVASRVTLSVRRGAWVMPKYLLGKPLDQGRAIPTWLPGALSRRLGTLGIRWLVGDMQSFGLPKPDHLVGEAHPTLSDELLPLLRAGKIQVRGPIESASGLELTYSSLPGLADSAGREAVDGIVYGTGYKVSFPFFAPDFMDAPQNELPLFGRVFHAKERRVFFLGLAQTLGAIIPTVERQAAWVAEYLSGRYNLPEPEAMERVIRDQDAARRRRYVDSPRHTMQLDPGQFALFLQRELKRGQRRAERGLGLAFADLAKGPGEVAP